MRRNVLARLSIAALTLPAVALAAPASASADTTGVGWAGTVTEQVSDQLTQSFSDGSVSGLLDYSATFSLTPTADSFPNNGAYITIGGWALDSFNYTSQKVGTPLVPGCTDTDTDTFTDQTVDDDPDAVPEPDVVVNLDATFEPAHTVDITLPNIDGTLTDTDVLTGGSDCPQAGPPTVTVYDGQDVGDFEGNTWQECSDGSAIPDYTHLTGSCTTGFDASQGGDDVVLQTITWDLTWNGSTPPFEQPFDNSPQPLIDGSPSVGTRLTTDVGDWEPAPTGFAYVWDRDGVSVGTGSSYLVSAADAGHSLTVTVTASAPGYATTARMSGSVAIPVGASPPTVTSTTPAAGAVAVALTAPITVGFSKAVTNVNATTIKLASGGVNVAGAVTYNASTHKATFKPTKALTKDKAYTVSVSGVKASVGGAAVAPTSWSFVTGPAPVASTVTPKVGATAVAKTANVTAKFSEAITGWSTVTAVITQVSGGAVIPAVVTYATGTNTLTINPSATLAAKTAYRVTLTGGAAAIRDLVGNPLVTKTWTFTTGS